jgi:hypothetical protein
MKFESHDYLYKAMHMATKKFYYYRQGPKETESENTATFKDLLDAIIYYSGSLGDASQVIFLEWLGRNLHDAERQDRLKFQYSVF